jgi:hypothetical protein
METNEEKQDSLTCESDDLMRKEEKETVTEEEREGSIGAVAAAMTTTSECPKTDRKPAAAATSRVTPSPDAVVTKRSLSDVSDNETPWHERKMRASSVHSPTVVNPRIKAAESTVETNEEEEDPPMQREAKRARTKPVPLGPLPMPSSTQKEAALQELKNPADRALQMIVWDIGCRYTLLAHQPEAVRAVAGLPAFFPLRSAQAEHDDVMSCSEKFLSFPIQSKTKGFLLADEMVRFHLDGYFAVYEP